MRWDALFDDLEAQLEFQRHQRLAAEAEEESELQRRRMTLAQRLRAHRGSQARVRLSGLGSVELTVGAVGEGWFAGLAGAQSCLVLSSAVVAVEGLSLRGRPEEGRARASLGLSAALVGLARDRAEISVHTSEGEAARGVLGAVGADHIDVLVRETGAGGALRRTVPLDAVLMLRSAAADFVEG
ncbi:hypothetical protein [Nesterenkonia populi]|uniref:hypothetical protein n=1 Tax=Nesterenkonia populi TaxID=1591087 RepID=UPI0011BF5006|nr:hypothetical protein [Nesterenkonia populi]